MAECSMFFSTLTNSSTFSFGKASYEGLKAKNALLDYGFTFVEKRVSAIGKPVLEVGSKLIEKYPKQAKVFDKKAADCLQKVEDETPKLLSAVKDSAVKNCTSSLKWCLQSSVGRKGLKMMTSVINATEVIIDKIEDKKIEEKLDDETNPKENNENKDTIIDKFTLRGRKIFSFFLKVPLTGLVNVLKVLRHRLYRIAKLKQVRKLRKRGNPPKEDKEERTCQANGHVQSESDESEHDLENFDFENYQSDDDPNYEPPSSPSSSDDSSDYESESERGENLMEELQDKPPTTEKTEGEEKKEENTCN
ncbi:DgyrCDS11754 [Dimorphilus gyrociliatus]|uniref:DgyrCDS11754 n=1 Tax=Dimorphilus gyrociliatus TaxID=2664684 RepID=A0A7I8W4B8_9ANNE|nr:DgyrCDS11754 [Dimorphilus gyrociliatus]